MIIKSISLLLLSSVMIFGTSFSDVASKRRAPLHAEPIPEMQQRYQKPEQEAFSKDNYKSETSRKSSTSTSSKKRPAKGGRWATSIKGILKS